MDSLTNLESYIENMKIEILKNTIATTFGTRFKIFDVPIFGRQQQGPLLGTSLGNIPQL